MTISVNRRDFARGLGGVVFAFTLDPALAQQPKQLPGSLGGNRMLDAWIRINADGTATVFTGKVELGQGIVTALITPSATLSSPACASSLGAAASRRIATTSAAAIRSAVPEFSMDCEPAV